ncbi:MAG: peptidylprolyl isomerase [Pseudomonadota bacterium]
MITAGQAHAANHKADENTNKEEPMSETVTVLMTTSLGDITLELDAAKAPATVANFKSYLEDGHYDGTIFHRVIPNFMIQGGGFEIGMQQKATKTPVENEADNGLVNDKYTVAMARTPDPNSATSQFFINTKDNDFLNFKSKTPSGWGYAVFGKVVDGFDTVDQIEKVSTGSAGPHGDVPRTDVIIISAKLL